MGLGLIQAEDKCALVLNLQVSI